MISAKKLLIGYQPFLELRPNQSNMELNIGVTSLKQMVILIGIGNGLLIDATRRFPYGNTYVYRWWEE